MIQITETTTKLEKKQGFKNAYKELSKTENIITSKQHNLTTNDDTCKWFRRLGGSESKTMAYTCDGYKCIKLISTSPDKLVKKIREYKFKFLE